MKAGKQQGFEITVDTNKTMADSLNLAVDKKNPYFNTMLRMIATRCMMQVNNNLTFQALVFNFVTILCYISDSLSFISYAFSLYCKLLISNFLYISFDIKKRKFLRKLIKTRHFFSFIRLKTLCYCYQSFHCLIIIYLF